MTDTPSPGWLVLIHQIPPRPAYLRVKIGRRLTKVGAVAIKNSVYVLPRGDSRMEDFQWIRREVVTGGGEAAILEAQLLDGLSDQEVEQLFRNERDAQYELVSKEARRLAKQIRGRLSAARRQPLRRARETHQAGLPPRHQPDGRDRTAAAAARRRDGRAAALGWRLRRAQHGASSSCARRF